MFGNLFYEHGALMAALPPHVFNCMCLKSQGLKKKEIKPK